MDGNVIRSTSKVVVNVGQIRDNQRQVVIHDSLSVTTGRSTIPKRVVTNCEQSTGAHVLVDFNHVAVKTKTILRVTWAVPGDSFELELDNYVQVKTAEHYVPLEVIEFAVSKATVSAWRRWTRRYGL